MFRHGAHLENFLNTGEMSQHRLVAEVNPPIVRLRAVIRCFATGKSCEQKRFQRFQAMQAKRKWSTTVGTLTIEMAADIVRLQQDVEKARTTVENTMFSKINKAAGSLPGWR